MRRALRHRWVIAAALAVSACSGDRPGSGVTPPVGPPVPPPNASKIPPIALNDTITGDIKSLQQVDSMRLVATGQWRVRVDLRELSGTGLNVTKLRYALVDSASGTTVETGFSMLGPDLGPDVGDRRLRWTRLLGAGTYVLTVQAQSSSTFPSYLGPYRLRLVGADTRPETARGDLVLGDTVVESIDRPGDVDEFILPLNGGSPDFVLVLRAETGVSADTLIAAPVNPIERPGVSWSTEPPIVASAGDALFSSPSPIGTLIQKRDTLRVRVSAMRGATVGRYRLAFGQIDRRPERAAPQLVAGDTVVELLDQPRDVDEYTFVGDSAREYVVALQGTSGSSADTVVLDVVGVARVRSAGTSRSLFSDVSPRLPGGRYTIRVAGARDEVARGSYRLGVFPIEPRPERVPPTLALGDTVSEALDHASDVDEFTVPVRAGDNVVVYAQAPGAAFEAGIQVEAATTSIEGSATPVTFSRLFERLVEDVPLRATRSPLFVARADGAIRLRVTGLGGYAKTYRLAAVRIDSGPERSSRRVTFDVPVGEAVDPPGDLDEYLIDARAGQSLMVFLERSNGAQLELREPSGRIVAFAWPSYLPGYDGRLALGRPLEVSGTYRMLISAPWQDPAPVPYRFVVSAVNRAPERAAASVRIGDAFEEAITPGLDVDEFRLDVPAGARFVVCVQTVGQSGAEAGSVALHMRPAGNEFSSYFRLEAPSGAAAPTCSDTVARVMPESLLLGVHGTNGFASPLYRVQIRAVP